MQLITVWKVSERQEDVTVFSAKEFCGWNRARLFHVVWGHNSLHDVDFSVLEYDAVLIGD